MNIKVKQKVVDIIKEALVHRGFSDGETEQLINRLLKYGEDAAPVGPPRMPFGKYKDIPIDEVPHEYLNWLLAQSWFREKYDALYKDIMEII